MLGQIKVVFVVQAKGWVGKGGWAEGSGHPPASHQQALQHLSAPINQTETPQSSGKERTKQPTQEMIQRVRTTDLGFTSGTLYHQSSLTTGLELTVALG